eukprot:TRINITY_DN880_c0_g1_i2.p1 TRINITY_DN880_c0_g1~~TRINITY_DN880_c0_g1_i2.p1  ORF type:complete len:273 (-),score=83.02 TRINITY_DN880_c0_g1_i2:212-1030(-)
MADQQQAEIGELWYFPISFASQKARLGLEEKGVKYNLKFVDILAGGNLTPEFLRLNPNATVPVLKLSDRVLTDSADIIRYANEFGEPLGGEDADQEKFSYWLQRQGEFNDTTYAMAAGSKQSAALLTDYRVKVAEKRAAENPELKVLYEKRVAAFKKYFDESRDASKVAENQAKLSKLLDDAQEQLSKTPFLAGNAFSMSDVVLMTVVARVDMGGKLDKELQSRPVLAEYWKKVTQRKSYKTVVGHHHGIRALPTLLPSLGKIIFGSAFKFY